MARIGTIHLSLSGLCVADAGNANVEVNSASSWCTEQMFFYWWIGAFWYVDCRLPVILKYSDTLICASWGEQCWYAFSLIWLSFCLCLFYWKSKNLYTHLFVNEAKFKDHTSITQVRVQRSEKLWCKNNKKNTVGYPLGAVSHVLLS